MFLLNGNPLSIDTPFTHNGTSYPSNWLRLTTLEQKQAIGITEVADTVSISYDDRFYWSVDNPKQLEDITVTPENGSPYIQKGLKTHWTANIKEITNKLLSHTDWMVIRKAERNVDIPTETVTHRANVLAECTRLVTDIENCSSVEALITILNTQQWPAQ